MNVGYIILSFNVLKNSEYSEEMKEEFVEKILPRIYKGYLMHKDGNPDKINGCYYFRVELYQNQFIIHEGIQ